MKKLFSFFALMLAFAGSVNAQWISPGNGTTYTLDDLVEASEGCVTFEPTSDSLAYYYVIHDDITISATDQLYIDISEGTVSTCLIFHEDGKSLTIKGSMVAIGRDVDLPLYISKEAYNHAQIRFENASDASLFNKCIIRPLSGIDIIASDVTFESTYIEQFDTYYQSSAVKFMNCDPVFRNSYFISNQGSAISSGANVTGSPQIYNCGFYDNVTANANQPQINLGPGADDTIRIVNCTIEGYGHDMSGGIAIADLMGTGETKILLRNNSIRNNRYGYNQQGYNLSSVIVDNRFVDNNLETNPNNGGSGISIYGMNTNNKAKLRNNKISGNLWGITAIYYHDIDMGTEDDWGYNLIYNNGNGGTTYALYNNGYSDISAIGNYWGGDEAFAESVIYHRPNLGETYGLVTYLPLFNPTPCPISLVATQEDNPQFSTDYQGVIDIENSRIDFFIPEDELSTLNIAMRLEIPHGSTTTFPSYGYINLSEPFPFEIETPIGDYQWWTIYLNSDWNAEENAQMTFNLFYDRSQNLIRLSNPIEDEAFVSVCNALGQTVYAGRLGAGQQSIEANTLAKGLYIVNLSAGKRCYSQKLIID